MNNTINNSNSNLYNVCSLEHCYTNLFALTDITGIKWLRLRVNDLQNKKSKSLGNKKKNKNSKMFEQDDEDDEDEDEDDDDDDEDEDDEDDDDEEQKNQEATNTNVNKESSTPKNSHKDQDQLKSDQSSSIGNSIMLNTTCINDPILLTHAKCLNEDILCSWKRMSTNSSQTNSNTDQQQKLNNEIKEDMEFKCKNVDDLNYKKELWIFWYEKEEPANLLQLISKELIAYDPTNSQQQSQSSSQQQQQSNQLNKNILKSAMSSNNGLPYECRSMLFKALHNLIEKSLIEKGYARLGKWFVMPYNLNSINYFNNISHNGTASANNEDIVVATTSASTMNNKSKMLTNQLLQQQQQQQNDLNLIDDSNHVSYSFSFFLHGASRVCTSVDIKMHRPIRLLNKLDLLRLRYKMKQYLEYKSTVRLTTTQNSNKKVNNQIKYKRFRGINVILAPYGISAKLIGYLANDCIESKLTCQEWKQFYPLKLNSTLPNVLVVGMENNKLKLFYPNSFVYIVVDSDNDTWHSKDFLLYTQQEKNYANCFGEFNNEKDEYSYLNSGSGIMSSSFDNSDNDSFSEDNDDIDDEDDDSDNTSSSSDYSNSSMKSKKKGASSSSNASNSSWNSFDEAFKSNGSSENEQENDEMLTNPLPKEEEKEEDENDSENEINEIGGDDDENMDQDLDPDDDEYGELDFEDDDDEFYEDQDDDDVDDDEEYDSGDDVINYLKAHHNNLSIVSSCSSSSNNQQQNLSPKHLKSSNSFSASSASATGGNKLARSMSTVAKSSKSKEKESKEMDSLDLTIDSVARNFGTSRQNNASSNSTSEQKSPKLNSSPSVTAASPSSSIMLQSPPGTLKRRPSITGSTQSPLKSQLKRTKSGNSIIEPLGPPTGLNKSGGDGVHKKRKYNQNTSGSSIKKNNKNAVNDDKSLSQKGRKNANFSNAGKKSIIKKKSMLSNRINKRVKINGSSKLRRINSIGSRRSNLKINKRNRNNQFQSQEFVSYKKAKLVGKFRKLTQLKKLKVNNLHSLINIGRKRLRSSKSASMSGPSNLNANCLVEQKFNKKLSQQIKIKHKKYDLINENFPLAFDLLDKCQLNTCTSSLCTSANNCTRCAILNSKINNQEPPQSQSEPLASSNSQQFGLSSTFGNVKTEPQIPAPSPSSNSQLNQIAIPAPSSTLNSINNNVLNPNKLNTDLFNILSTKYESFHRRNCYFNHSLLDNNYASSKGNAFHHCIDKNKKYLFNNQIKITKKLQFRQNQSQPFQTQLLQQNQQYNQLQSSAAFNSSQKGQKVLLQQQQQQLLQQKQQHLQQLQIQQNQRVITKLVEIKSNNRIKIKDFKSASTQKNKSFTITSSSSSSDSSSSSLSSNSSDNDADDDGEGHLDDNDLNDLDLIDENSLNEYDCNLLANVSLTDEPVSSIFKAKNKQHHLEHLTNYQYFDKDSGDSIFGDDEDLSVPNQAANTAAISSVSAAAVSSVNGVGCSSSSNSLKKIVDLSCISSSSSNSSNNSSNMSIGSGKSNSNSSSSSLSSSPSSDSEDSDDSSSSDSSSSSTTSSSSSSGNDLSTNERDEPNDDLYLKKIKSSNTSNINSRPCLSNLTNKLEATVSYNSFKSEENLAEEDKFFDNLYANNDLAVAGNHHTSSSSIGFNPNNDYLTPVNTPNNNHNILNGAMNNNIMDDPYEFRIEENGTAAGSSTNACANPKASQQMTPPKSVESMQTPLSNNPQPASNELSMKPASMNALFTSASQQHHSSANIPPISYDDLNNIFEEESSADEQQQPAQQKQTQPNGSSLSSNSSIVNPQQQPSAIDQIVQQQQPPPAQHQLNTIQTSLSVVMTPPSHESTNQNNVATLHALNSNASSGSSQNNNQLNNMHNLQPPLSNCLSISQPHSNLMMNPASQNNVDDCGSSVVDLMSTNESLFMNKVSNLSTKSMKLNDYASIINNKNRPSLFATLMMTTTTTTTTTTSINTMVGIFDSNRLKPHIEGKANLFEIPALEKFTELVSKNQKYKKINMPPVKSEVDLLKTSRSNYINNYIFEQTNETKIPSKKLKWNSSANQRYLKSKRKALANARLTRKVIRRINKPFRDPVYIHLNSKTSKQYLFQQQQQKAQLNQPYHLTRTLSCSSSSYPGSVGQSQVNSVGTPSMYNNANTVLSPQVNPKQTFKQQQSILSNKKSSTNNFNQQVQQQQSMALQKLNSINTVASSSSILANNRFKLKPLDQLTQIEHAKLTRSNLDLKFYLNSICLNMSLNDTLLNLYRDINFDSCTLCVCNNNNIKGIDYQMYILNDLFNNCLTNNYLNEQASASNTNNAITASASQQNNSLVLNNSNTMQQQQQSSGSNLCTCGFSSIVNRSFQSRQSYAIKLNLLISLIKRLRLLESSSTKSTANMILPYFNLVNMLNKFTKKSKRNKQFIVMNSTNCNGLFLEDYNDILNIVQPHYLLNFNIKNSNSNSLKQITSNLITSKFTNSLLIRENYSWKKSFTFKNKPKSQQQESPSFALQHQQSVSIIDSFPPPSNNPISNQSTPNKRQSKKQQKLQLEQQQQQLAIIEKQRKDQELIEIRKKQMNFNVNDEKLIRKLNGEYEIVDQISLTAAPIVTPIGNKVDTNIISNPGNLLDLFEQKYSCPMIGLHEQFDLFYSNGRQFDFEDDECYNSDYEKFYENFDCDNYTSSRGIAQPPFGSFKSTHLSSAYKRKMKKAKRKHQFKLNSLSQLDDNNVCVNAIKRLYLISKYNRVSKPSNEKEDEERMLIDEKIKLKSLFNSKSDDSFILHNWLYSKKDIKSNLELTKSLKLIQPLLEETVQKKYTTSRMWESFQGPLTWQHFCRLAFRDSSSSSSSHHQSSHSSHLNNHMNNTNANAGSSTNSGSSNSSAQNCYEPEPIPALVVSTSDKDWHTISPYAVKFWDKLNLEPYSKHKNIAYIVLMPDFSLNTSTNNPFSNNLNSNFSDFNSNMNINMENGESSDYSSSDNQFQTMLQNVKDYFKELNSIYELCHLGIHRPALRIAPDQGFVRVPLINNSANGKFKYPRKSATNKIKVDKWFTQIQENKATRQLGRNLKSYARIFKSLANKISAGHSSTISTTIQSTIFSSNSLNGSPSSKLSKTPHPASTFNSTVTPTISTINLDRTIYEELKQSKFDVAGPAQHQQQQHQSSLTSNQSMHTSSLSSLLNQPIHELTGTSHSHNSPLDFTSTSQQDQAAQILTNFSTSNAELIEKEREREREREREIMRKDQALSQQNQQTLNNLASGSNLTQISQLTSNMTSPPSLVVYIIDPFDYYLYNTRMNNKYKKSDDSSKKNKSKQKNKNFKSSKSTKTDDSINNSNVTGLNNLTQSPKATIDEVEVKKEPNQTLPPKSEPNDHPVSADQDADSDLDLSFNDNNEDENDFFEELDDNDLKRLRILGMFKAYLEFYNSLPDLFKYSTQFQIIPLSLCNDMQQHSTSMYMQSLMHQKASQSNYSSCFSSGLGTSWSDLDMDFKLSFLKTQAFNIFSISKRYFMSPAHNFYMSLHQQQNNSLRPKSLTGFGPAAYEEKFLKEILISNPNSVLNTSFNQFKKWQFYSPPFILAPSTITTSAVALAASNLFYKHPDYAKQASSNQSNNNQLSIGECNLAMPHFIQLNMSNSNNGFLNSQNSYNFNLGDLIQQQSALLGMNGGNQAGSLGSNSGSGSSMIGGFNSGSSSSNQGMSGSGGGLIGSSSSTSQSNLNPSAMSASGSSNAINSNYLMTLPHQQQCNVLYVGYCLSEDQRYLLTSCCDENGELIESTSILIELDERMRRKDAHVRRIALRKLWEFIIVIISQTCKPWRLVIGRLGRMGHSELRGWGCLLSKKNLQRVCQQLKDTCETCNTYGNLETPSILSACLISMETCDNICVYPEAFSREDKIAAAALTGQQLSSNHAAQAHGVSCTHILTFPVSAIIQTQSASMLGVGSGMKDGDPMSKSHLGAMQMDDNDFFDFFKFDDGEDMNELLNDNINDKVLNESGAAVDNEQVNAKEKLELLLNQEEISHLDQQPLAVGYYVSTAKCGPLPKWLRGDVSLDTNFHTFKATLHIHNRYALENDELIMKTENSHKLDSSITYEVLRYVLERYNALSWLNIDPLIQDRKSCLPIHHTILLQMYYAFKNYI